MKWRVTKGPLFDAAAIRAFEILCNIDASFCNRLNFLHFRVDRQLYMSTKLTVSSGEYNADYMYFLVQESRFTRLSESRNEQAYLANTLGVDEQFYSLSRQAFDLVLDIADLRHLVTDIPHPASWDRNADSPRAHDSWCLLVHELSDTVWRELEGFDGVYMTHVLPDLKTESATILHTLAAGYVPRAIEKTEVLDRAPTAGSPPAVPVPQTTENSDAQRHAAIAEPQAGELNHPAVDTDIEKHERPLLPTPRVTVNIEAGIVTIDGEPVAIVGGNELRKRIAKFIDELLKKPGEYLNMSNNDVRTRDIDQQPKPINQLFDSQPGAGTRIPRERVFGE